MMKRIISLLAAFCLLLTMMPTSVWAKTITNMKTPDKPTMTEFRQPQITGLEKLDKEPIILPPDKDPASMNDNGDYLSMSEAVAELRKQMMNRAENITIKVKTTNGNSSDVFTSLFYDAMEHTGEPGAGDNLMWQWGMMGAGDGFSGYTSGGYYYYTLPYWIDYYTTAAMEAELDAAVEELLDDLNLYSASDYDKISGVYEYITENITYDYYNLNRDPYYEPMYTAYAALVDGTAVCQGYANLFYRLMLELDVDTRIVVGDAGGPHAWNIVELEDWYYYVDSTWDATYAQAGWGYQYYLLGSNNFSLDHTDDPEECPFLPDYRISATDYVPGQPGQEPEPETWPQSGYCGDDMTWTLTEEGLLTISGTGEMWDYNDYFDPEWYSYTNQIRECVVEEGVTELGDYAFYKCYSLTSIELPDSLEYTGEGAFTYCESLTNVTIPDGVIAIGRQTFAGCSALTSVTIPASVLRIGEIAFLYCYALQDVYYGGSPSQWKQIEIQEDNECLLDATIHYGAEDPEPDPGTNPDPEPEPDPDEVYTGYCGDNLIWTLTPDGLLTISGTGAMWDYPSSEPGWYAYVDQVQECVIEEGVTTIGTWAFWDCWALERITVKEGLSVIGEGAFSFCYGLRDLNLPASITTIDTGAFYECYSLSDVYYAGSAAQWSEIFIDELNEDLLSATIHYGVEEPIPEPDLPEADFLKVEWEVLRETNRERAEAGVLPLTTTETLFRAADVRALELAEQYSHTRPDGSSFDSILTELGLGYRMAGENIDVGHSTAKETVSTWMGTVGGSDKITSTFYTHLGVGYKDVPGSTYGAYWEQLFYTDEYCHYTGFELNTDGVIVEQYAGLEDAQLWGIATCGTCGVCYLPILEEYCIGFDPDTPGTQMVTVSVLNFSDTLEVTVIATEPDPEPEPPVTDYLEEEWEVLKLTNLERYKEGMIPLTTTDLMVQAADIRAEELTILYSHYRPVYGEDYFVLDQLHFDASFIGENISAGQSEPEQVVADWMNSNYRQNILHPYYLHLGVGHEKIDSGEHDYWAQVFATGAACEYTGFALNVDSLEVEQGAELADLPLWGIVSCEYCGDCYLPILAEYCTGYDPNIPGTQTVTVSVLNYSDTLEVTVIGTEPDPDYGTCGMSEETVYEILIGMKDEYYEGRPWTNDDSYRWNINNTIGYGCAAFAFLLSDAAFGDLPSQTIYEDITIDDLRVGDILRVYNDAHSVVVLEVHDDYIVLAEGNYNNSIHWGRTMTAEEVAEDTDYVVTRYPEHNFVDGVCTECGAEEEGGEPDPTPEVEAGDTNGDGKINTLDLYVLRRHLTDDVTSVDSTGADLNGDGKINTLDLIMLRRYLNGDL